MDRSAATQLELDVDAFLDFMSELETSGSGEITGDLYMYLLDEYQAGKVRGSNAVSPRRYVTSENHHEALPQKTYSNFF